MGDADSKTGTLHDEGEKTHCAAAAAAAQGEGRHMWGQALPVEYEENILATDYT